MPPAGRHSPGRQREPDRAFRRDAIGERPLKGQREAQHRADLERARSDEPAGLGAGEPGAQRPQARDRRDHKRDDEYDDGEPHKPPRQRSAVERGSVHAALDFRPLSSESVADATLTEILARALAEDIGDGDVTTAATVPERAMAHAIVTQKAPGVVFGLDVAAEVFRLVDPELAVQPLTREGEWREHGPVLELEGRARSILTAERTALNFLARLSGVATMAARAVRAVEGTGATILDTRKTTPGLRALEKAAVAAGGATNHRFGLFDAILIKENHAALAGGVGEAVRKARASAPELTLEVECRTLAEVDEALDAGRGGRDFIILLDNMSVEQLTEAVLHVGGRARLEASGGVTLDTLREIASTGVDFVSVGALTHSAPALDLSLLLEPIS